MKKDTVNALSTYLEPDDLFKVLKYKHEFNKAHPDWFRPDGIIVFSGPQGSGKTLSAVRYVDVLLKEYPKAKICSNVMIEGYEDRFVFFEGVSQFKSIRNGEYGVIFLIDEIHLLFNSLQSKNVDLNLFTTICQQRKQRVHIVGTAQLFHRIAKPFREQFKYAVMCTNIMEVLQFNKIVKGSDCEVDETTGKVTTEKVYRQFFFHSPELYEKYDTYAVIDRTNFNFNWEDITPVKEEKESYFLLEDNYASGSD